MTMKNTYKWDYTISVQSISINFRRDVLLVMLKIKYSFVPDELSSVLSKFLLKDR